MPKIDVNRPAIRIKEVSSPVVRDKGHTSESLSGSPMQRGGGVRVCVCVCVCVCRRPGTALNQVGTSKQTRNNQGPERFLFAGGKGRATNTNPTA